MSKKDTIANMAVRLARAEMERDAAIKRAEDAEQRALESSRAAISVMNRDPEMMLDNIHLMGIPARDWKDLYDAEARVREFKAKRA